MQNIDWVTFILKLVLVPTFVAVISFAGRRWGATVGGWLIGLPFNSAPIAFFLALEQGSFFASKASEAIMLGVSSVFIFCLTYSRIAKRLSWFQSIPVAFVAFFISTFILDELTLPLFAEFGLALLILIICAYLMPHVGTDRLATWQTRWELPVRMVSATALVILITALAPLLGSQLTGLLSPFPIYATTLAVFVHRSQGGEEAIKLLRGVVVGSITFIVFFLILSLSIIQWGIALSFLMAIGVSFLTHFCSLQILKYRNRIPGLH